MIQKFIHLAFNLLRQDSDALGLTLTCKVGSDVAIVVGVARHMKLKTDCLSTLIRRLLEAKVVLTFRGRKVFEMICRLS